MFTRAGTPAPEELLSQPLPPPVRAAVEQWYAADIALYHYALELHRKQLQWVQSLQG